MSSAGDQVATNAALQAKGKLLDPGVYSRAAAYHETFRNAQPFPNVIIDGFFRPSVAEDLLADFPPFSSDNARDGFGRIGRKAVVTDIARISPAYSEVARYIASAEFLDFISRVTGIADLVHDGEMFGGGTHENLEGQKLDPHVDFNYLEDRRLHRRLNLLVYLNVEWKEDWGGCLELHSNPRRPRENTVTTILPLFNRAVLFETSERSWHGFEQIRLPEDRKQLSRKALSIYLYTRDRPADELVAPHRTFYVQRPAPARFVAGYTLDAHDTSVIEQLLTERDAWIEFYQNREITDSATIQQCRQIIAERDAEIERLRQRPQELTAVAPNLRDRPPLQVPIVGDARQQEATGFYDDNWIVDPFAITLELDRAVEAIELRGYLPEGSGAERELHIAINERPETIRPIRTGPFSIRIACRPVAADRLDLRIRCDRAHCPARAGTGPDLRQLMALLFEVRLLHAGREGQP